MQQKERIRSLITPGDDMKEKNKKLDPGLHENLIENNEGRSPFEGAKFKVVSVNHKKQGANPVFDNQNAAASVEQEPSYANNSSAPDKGEDEAERSQK